MEWTAPSRCIAANEQSVSMTPTCPKSLLQKGFDEDWNAMFLRLIQNDGVAPTGSAQRRAVKHHGG
jgi:hypothetical protein